MSRFQFQTDTPVSTGPSVNFDELGQYVFETVNAPEPDARIMIVSGIVDLGFQKQEDAKMEWTGSDAQRAEIEAKAAAGETKEYFEVVPHGQNNVPTLCKRWPVKDLREVAIFVDDPATIINRGKFFDEDGVGEDLPYRMMLNNEFFQKGVGKVPGRAINLKEHRDDAGNWGFKNNTILYKIGQAVGALDAQKQMKPQYLGNLIGKAILCNVTVTLNEGSDGKKYLNEKVGFNGPVPKAMIPLIPVLDEKHMFMINMKGENDPNAVKNLRQSCINVIKQASNFAESDLRKQLIAAGKIKEDEGNLTSGNGETPQASKPEASRPAPKQAAPQPDPLNFENFDDDIPF
jgi:hypothetical protein